MWQDLIDAVSGYPGLFLGCLLSGILIPVPEDVPQVLAGMQIASGEMAWLPAIAVAATGAFLRDSLYFGAGRWLGDRAFSHPWVLRLLGAARIEQARERVRTRGPVAVVIGRFSLGLRAGTFLIAGAMGVKPRHFVLYDLAALALSVPLMMMLGHAVGQPVIDTLLWTFDRARWALPLTALLAGGAWWVWSQAATHPTSDHVAPSQ